MVKEIEKYTLEDFLDDPDFCNWALFENPDLDDYYRQQLVKYPEQKEIFQKAHQLVMLFDDEKLQTEMSRKLQIWDEVNRVCNQNTTSKKYKLFFRYAAVITLLSIITSLTYYFISSTPEIDFISSYNMKDFSETKLLLDNGKEINIHSDRSEIVCDQDGSQIKVNNELLKKGKSSGSAVMNQLIVPFGKQSKIILADRTEVWLNAGSRLIYPTVFEGGKRLVKLQGEAYFKVSKDKSKPFIVETNHSKIKVLGTSFNVKAYPDEKVEETVLVEGSVSLNLRNTIFGKDIQLKPEQRLVVTDPDSYSISEVDVDNYTSWIEGLFVFKDELLPSVLLRISRYYNLEIKWTNDAKTKKISGKLDLKEDYQRVINALALISDGNYIEENNVIYFKLK